MALFRWKQTRGKNKKSETLRAVYFSCWECGHPTSLPVVAVPAMEVGFALTCFQAFPTPTSQQPLRFLEANALVFSKINLFLKCMYVFLFQSSIFSLKWSNLSLLSLHYQLLILQFEQVVISCTYQMLLSFHPFFV